jgi:hypothetical protein
MMTEATPKTQKSQLDKFKDAARELECDDDGQRFDERLKSLVGSPKAVTRGEGGR